MVATVATKVVASAVVSGKKRAVATRDERGERCRGERRRRKEDEKGIIDAHGISFPVNASLTGNSRWVKSTRPACWRRRRPIDAKNPSSGDCGRLVDLQGTFNSKFDQLNSDDISISDLLQGNFTRPQSSHPERAKKASNSNESVVFSVRKAASVLRKAPTKEENLPSSSFSALDYPVCSPKAVLNKLGLSSNHDRDSISSQRTLPSCGLPPFPWSFSPAADSGKSTPNRNFYQSKWIRVGSNSCLMAGEGFDFSDLDKKITEADKLTFRETRGASASSPDLKRRHSPGALTAAEILCGMARPKCIEKNKSSIKVLPRPPLFRCSMPVERRDGGVAVAVPGFRGKNWRR